jgi:hypothetical protein
LREEEVLVSNQSIYPIVQLTSFGETDILNKIPSPKPRRAYLPIYPSPHPDTDVQLFLEGGVILRKNSYINTRDKHTIPLDILTAYERREPNTRYVLKSESYQRLINHAGFVPDPEASTSRNTIPPSLETPLSIQHLEARYGTIPGARAPVTLPVNLDNRDPGASTSNTISPPLPPWPETIRSQSERLKLPNHRLWESQYGAVPGARAPLLAGIDNRDPYNPPQSTSHHPPPARPPVRYTAQYTRTDTLPRYNNNNYNPPQSHGYTRTSNGGRSSPHAEAGPCWAVISVALVVAVVVGLWWVWTSLEAPGQGLLGGLGGAGVSMWGLAEGAVAGW